MIWKMNLDPLEQFPFVETKQLSCVSLHMRLRRQHNISVLFHLFWKKNMLWISFSQIFENFNIHLIIFQIICRSYNFDMSKLDNSCPSINLLMAINPQNAQEHSGGKFQIKSNRPINRYLLEWLAISPIQNNHK